MTIATCSPYTWSLEQDEVGHRDYHVDYLVTIPDTPYGYSGGKHLETSYPHATLGTGLKTAGSAAGLPSIGDYFQYGSEVDLWAKRHPQMRIRPHEQHKGEMPKAYMVGLLFSTRPMKRCMTSDWGSPLLEPQKVGGSFVRGKIEATKDRNGKPLKSSSHEMFRGPQVEFDSGHPTVRIEQNVSTLELALCTSLVDTVNDDTLWGLVSRRIKLSNFTWEERWYDVCTYYYVRVFDFEIKNKAGDLWDRRIIDEGTKVLNGDWSTNLNTGTDPCIAAVWNTINICGVTPDPDNPSHFSRYKDRWGEISRVILNGEGKPAETTELVVISPGSGITGTQPTGGIGEFLVEYYPESDFNQLGIPATIDYGTAT